MDSPSSPMLWEQTTTQYYVPHTYTPITPTTPNKRTFEQFRQSQDGVVAEAREVTNVQPAQVPTTQVGVGLARRWINTAKNYWQSWTKPQMVEEHNGIQHKRRMVIPGAWPESPSPTRRRRAPITPTVANRRLSPLRHPRTNELARAPTSPTPARSAPAPAQTASSAASIAVSVSPSAPTAPATPTPSTTEPSTPAPAPRRRDAVEPFEMPVTPSLEPRDIDWHPATPVAASALTIPAPSAGREDATLEPISRLAEPNTPAVRRSRKPMFQRKSIVTTLSPMAGRHGLSPQTPAAKRNDGPRGILKRPKVPGQHKRRVHFNEEGQFMQFCKPYPSKIKEYEIGGICGELPSPLNRRSFQIMQEHVPEASPARSDMSSPDRRPTFSDSPVRPIASWMRARSASDTSSSSTDQLDIAVACPDVAASVPKAANASNTADISNAAGLSHTVNDTSDTKVSSTAQGSNATNASTAAWVHDVQAAAAAAKSHEDNVDELTREYGIFSLSRKSDTTRRSKLEEERAAAQAAAAAELARLESERLAKEAADRAANAIVTPLSAEWSAKLAAAMATRDTFKPLAGNLTRKDFGTLLPQTRADGVGWLNDEIVNGYLAAIVSKAAADSGYSKSSKTAPRVHAFNTALYTTFQAKGYDGVKRWAQRAKVDGMKLFGVDCLLIPINDALHWTLLVVSGTRRTISYYDSLYSNPGKYTAFGRAFVKGVLSQEYREEEWEVVDASSSQQANGLDCGVFVCLNALAVALGRDPVGCFGAGEVAEARRMVAGTLLNGGMNADFNMKFYE